MTIMNPVKSFGLEVATQMQPYDPECPIQIGNHRYIREADLVPGLLFYRTYGSHAAAGTIDPVIYHGVSTEYAGEKKVALVKTPSIFRPGRYFSASMFLTDAGIIDNRHNQHRCFFTRKEAETYLRETAMLNHIMGVRQPGHLENWLGDIVD